MPAATQSRTDAAPVAVCARVRGYPPPHSGAVAAGLRSVIVGVILLFGVVASAHAARFVDVRVTDAVTSADGPALTLDLNVPPTPGPHPVLLAAGVPGASGSDQHAGWLHASVRIRAGTATQDFAATLAFVGRQIGAWGGDPDRIVLMTDDALLPALVAALDAGAARPVGVLVRVDADASGVAAVAAPAPGVGTPLRVLFDPRQSAARRDALRIAANWRRAGARADVLPAPVTAQGADLVEGLEPWASTFAVPRLARWETLVATPETTLPADAVGRAVGLVAHSGRLHVAVQGRGVDLWERAADGSWRRAHAWPAADALVWMGAVALDVPTLFAVLVESGHPILWMRGADGAWTVVARAGARWSGDAASRIVAQPDRAAALWLVDDGRAGTAVFDLTPTRDGSLRVLSTPGLGGRLVDAAVFDGAVVAATRADGRARLWRCDMAWARWRVVAELDTDTRTLAVVDGGASLLAVGPQRVVRVAAADAAPTVELELAEAFATLLDVPAGSVIRAVAPQGAQLVHPETGEVALVVGIDVADPDPRAPPARYLVRDAAGRYAIGEAWDAARGRGGWPQAMVADPSADGLVHWLSAGGGLHAARLPDIGPRRGLWAAAGGDGLLALERIGARWVATLVLPTAADGHVVRVATGMMSAVFSADEPGALDFGGTREAEPLVIAFDDPARAACLADGHADAHARVSVGAGDAVRYHCFRKPAGSAQPTRLNGAWGGGTGADRWLAFVDAARQGEGIAADVVLLVRDHAGGIRLVRAAGAGGSGELDLPLYADCPGCGARPIGNFRLVVDGACGSDAAAAGFVLLLPDGAGFRQRSYGAIERLAGPACY